MDRDTAFNQGKHYGFNAAIYCEVGGEDRNNCDCGDDTNVLTVCEECLSSAAAESERMARDFSPWEFTAHDINESDDAEELWEAYDDGVDAGIKDGVLKRLAS